ncbi:MAG: AAC(3) family N-acetyltransferase [Oscillospiraceae bacterium]|nr:AAC(3) family N-acetyltransferase [Oscillospiraceae bacterium]
MNTTQQIASDARALGVRPGSVLLVHSSLRSLGRKGIHPQEVIDGLLLALGDRGTLVFPALSYLHCGPAHSLTFDVRNTPSNVGALPEYFRTSVPGVRRSLCPTHSCCAIGEKQERVVGEHHLDDTPAGEHSPFRRVMELDGSVLFLGCGTNCNTSMHAVEELSRPEYLFEDCYTYTMIREDGNSYQQRCYAHDFRGVSQVYRRMEDLLTDTELQTGNILAAPCHLMRCVPMWEKADAKYRENPHYFVDPR